MAALFNYAVRYYDLNDNPCRKAGSIGKSKADDMEFWTKQEFKQFLPSMDKKPEARMAFMLLYWTGMRIGELLALTYEDIDLEKRIISISKSYQRLDGKDVITPPKTSKSNRKITIPPFLTEELKKYCSHLYGIMSNERMFRFTKSYMEHEIVRGILLIGHMNKASGNKAAYRGMGSIDFFAVARSVLLVGRIEGEPNTRAVVQIKNNLAVFGHPKAFMLSETGFHWLGDYEITADEVLGGIAPKANKLEQAKQMLRELAETTNMVQSNEIFETADKQGISKRTLENAKKELGIQAKKINNSWYWKLDAVKQR